MDISKMLRTVKLAGAEPRAGVSVPNAIENIQKRKDYNNYSIDKQSNGEAAVPFEEWDGKK